MKKRAKKRDIEGCIASGNRYSAAKKQVERTAGPLKTKKNFKKGL